MSWREHGPSHRTDYGVRATAAVWDGPSRSGRHADPRSRARGAASGDDRCLRIEQRIDTTQCQQSILSLHHFHHRWYRRSALSRHVPALRSPVRKTAVSEILLLIFTAADRRSPPQFRAPCLWQRGSILGCIVRIVPSVRLVLTSICSPTRRSSGRAREWLQLGGYPGGAPHNS